VDVMADSFVDDLPDEHRTCVFRVVQEALRNATRHSGARHVRIAVEDRDGFLRLSVADDGKGFAPSLETGLGILGMQERIASLSGKMSVNSQPGHGAEIVFELPIPPAGRAGESAVVWGLNRAG
jgi:signal transduction histidine kinase